MATVRRWTGHEARVLRVAKRMSVRQFAEHLGVTAAAVSNWERRGLATRLRYETQQMLDVDLARAPDDVQERFQRSLEAPAATEASGAGPNMDSAVTTSASSDRVTTPSWMSCAKSPREARNGSPATSPRKSRAPASIPSRSASIKSSATTSRLRTHMPRKFPPITSASKR